MNIQVGAVGTLVDQYEFPTIVLNMGVSAGSMNIIYYNIVRGMAPKGYGRSILVHYYNVVVKLYL